MNIKEDIEKLEKKSFDFVWESLLKNQDLYHEYFNQLSFEELRLFLSRQGKGRSTKYKYELNELFENINSLNEEMKLELQSRIASSSIFSKGFERIINSLLVSSFVENKINFTMNSSPNSPNFSVFLELKDTDTQISTEKIHGVLLNVETNTINGFSNLGDAITNNYFGRFHIGINQITYNPPTLRPLLNQDNGSHLSQKYSTLDGYRILGEKNYIVVTIFVTLLSCLPNDKLFSDELKEINGSYFNHYIMCTCIPHVDLESDYYDNYFSPGKGGKEEKYPKDYRFQIYNENHGFLKFKNLNDDNNRFKFINNTGEYTCYECPKENFSYRNFFISDT